MDSSSTTYVRADPQSLIVLHLTDCLSQMELSRAEPPRLLLAARAIYSAAVTALTAAAAGTASIGAYPEKVRLKWLEFLENLEGDAPTRDKVMEPSRLLQMVRTDATGYLTAPLQMDMDEEFRFNQLSWLRNRVEHPRAESLAVEYRVIAAAILAGVQVTERCQKAVAHQFTEERQTSVSAFLGSITEQCAGILAQDGQKAKQGTQKGREG